MKHELWKEESGGYLFCLAGPMGDGARAMVDSVAELIWTVEANSHFEAMTKYWKFMNWGEYTTEFEEDKKPYPKSWTATQV
jgi:hypothetical protein